MKYVNILGKVSLVKIKREEGIVVKKFCRTDWLSIPEKVDYRGSLESCFMRELQCLRALQDHKNFPRLLGFDESRLTIVMEYCGSRLNLKANNGHYATQVETIVSVLKEKDILIDHLSSGTTDLGAVLLQRAKFYKSLLEKDGRLYLVDFETCVSFSLMNKQILTNSLIQACQNCNYDYLASEMKSFVAGESSELLIKYLRGKPTSHI